MNLLRKTATTLGGIFFAVLLIAALAPKATRGVAAALVQVTNTASDAVPTEDGPGNFPFGVVECAEVGTSTCGSSLPPFFVPVTTSTGAAVKRLVIEDVSAACQGGSVVSTVVFDVPLPADHVSLDGESSLRYLVPLTAIGSGGSVAHSTVRMYADPGTAIGTEMLGPFAGGPAACSLYLTGHLETK
ncbi:MAG TPA: hypothetical protein VN881_03695 [Candidatus Acidoferrales bacterium]|jgi:hypothetical protein|nr:hypothetical protein [Candidatus Acidoferrales bacterium]